MAQPFVYGIRILHLSDSNELMCYLTGRLVVLNQTPTYCPLGAVRVRKRLMRGMNLMLIFPLDLPFFAALRERRPWCWFSPSPCFSM